jgi:hypothetical protein
MGTILTTLLLAVAGQVPDDIVYTNQRKHRFPINIKSDRRAEIRELILYSSSDKGKSWQPVAKITPEANEFIFAAPADGEYWFRSAAINRQGKQEPENLYQGPPDQKMVIDTLKPIVKLVSAQRQGDEIVVAWDIQEEHPDAKTLKLEYQTVPGGLWTAVPGLIPGGTGKASFRPGSAGTVTVRMEVKDLGGNVSQAQAEVPGPSSGVTPAGFTGTPTPVTGSPSAPPALGSSNELRPPPPVNNDPPAAINIPREVTPPPSLHPIATSLQPPPSSNGPPRSAPPVLPSNTRLVASSDSPPSGGATAYQKQLPPAKHVNIKEVDLEYELTRTGPSGIGSVDLWWTLDDGQTWEKAPNPEVKDLVKDGLQTRYQRTVALLEGDRVYGFSLVVKSRAGLGKAPPKAGDVPEVRIELDTTLPLAQLFSPRQDPAKKDNLILSWKASDKNLTDKPITLEWAERPDGTWQTIAADIVDSGQYSWRPAPGMPVQVYLRLRVRDQAGNESVAVTPEPQLIDLTEPEGHLVNVSVPSRRP